MKKLTSLAIAATLFAAPSIAFAQSSPSPNNTTAPGVSPTAPAPTDPALGNESGNAKGIPQRGANSGAAMGTTGSGSTVKKHNDGASHTTGEKPAASGSKKY